MKINKLLHLPAMFHVIDARTTIMADPLFGISREAFDSCYPKLNDDFKNKTPFIFGTVGLIFFIYLCCSKNTSQSFIIFLNLVIERLFN